MTRNFHLPAIFLTVLFIAPSCTEFSPSPDEELKPPRFSLPTALDTRWVYHYEEVDWTRSGVGMGEERRDIKGTHIWGIGSCDTFPTYISCRLVCTRSDTQVFMRTNWGGPESRDTAHTSSWLMVPMTVTNTEIMQRWDWTITIDEGDLPALYRLPRDCETIFVKTHYTAATFLTGTGLVKYEYILPRGAGGVNGILSRRLTLVSGPEHQASRVATNSSIR